MDLAIEDLRRATELDESIPDYRLLLCDALFVAGRFEEAVNGEN
jgi:hypothetical protein